MQRVVIVCLMVLTFLSVLSKDIKLITSGTGATREEAVQNALMSAIEQAYGSFVSANTTVLNDELVKDEVVSLKKGNIKRYNVLYESGREDKTVTVEATVSPEKLTQFAVSRGSEAELAGQAFGMNLKLHKLHLKNGAVAMEHLYSTLSEISKNMYDYPVEVSNPVLHKEMVLVPVVVGCVLNKTGREFYNIYNKTYSMIMASINATRPDGQLHNDDIDKIDYYNRLCKKLPIEQMLGFVIRDNLKGKAELMYVEKTPIMKVRKEGGIKAKAIGMDVKALLSFGDSGYGDGYTPLYNYISKRAQIYDPSYPPPLAFISNLENHGDNYIEHAVDGAVRVHFVLCYPVSKFEKISKISAIPKSQAD